MNNHKGNLLEESLTKPDLSPEARFQQMGQVAERLLKSGQEIDQDTYEALGRPGIILVGNSQLNLGAVKLRSRDYQAIGTILAPGKSCLFNFLRLESQVTQQMVYIVKKNTLGENADRRDNIWVTDLYSIRLAGFRLFYAPVSTNKLHLRIVWEGYDNIQFPTIEDLPEIPEQAQNALIAAFRKIPKANTSE